MLFSQFQGPSESAFLRAAIKSYCGENCPLAGQADTCPMLTWRESVHTGALEKVCRCPPEAWSLRLMASGRANGRASA